MINLTLLHDCTGYLRFFRCFYAPFLIYVYFSFSFAGTFLL